VLQLCISSRRGTDTAFKNSCRTISAECIGKVAAASDVRDCEVFTLNAFDGDVASSNAI
jgi:hypothetical protein